MTDNPYESPVEKPAVVSSAPENLAVAALEDEDEDEVQGNLQLTAKLVTVSSICCAIAAIFTGITWVLGFSHLLPG